MRVLEVGAGLARKGVIGDGVAAAEVGFRREVVPRVWAADSISFSFKEVRELFWQG